MRTPSTGPESEPTNTSELKSEPLLIEKEIIRFHVERLQIDQLRLSSSKKKSSTQSLLSSFRMFREGRHELSAKLIREKSKQRVEKGCRSLFHSG
ncbi:hypothetical protein TNCT_471451 [Trichonephila clavata]|uniref:Uncharacterized protein n=1 Tax=Trichonephila clavata TaxID=2740835 RepID=A0A8X6HGA7_TRICU|nr:hypothetical protein TNCT_471451 [Trichonephila clavata]